MSNYCLEFTLKKVKTEAAKQFSVKSHLNGDTLEFCTFTVFINHIRKFGVFMVIPFSTLDQCQCCADKATICWLEQQFTNDHSETDLNY